MPKQSKRDPQWRSVRNERRAQGQAAAQADAVRTKRMGRQIGVLMTASLGLLAGATFMQLSPLAPIPTVLGSIVTGLLVGTAMWQPVRRKVSKLYGRYWE